MEDNVALGPDDIEQTIRETEIQTETRTERPLTVVADSSGFVGAFTDEKKAKEFIRPYIGSGVPLILYRFTLAANADQERVFVIPYRGSDAVAFVSNDIARCREVHATLSSVGLTYEDEVEYWEHPVDAPCAPAVNRLKTLLNGMNMCAAEAKEMIETAEAKEKQLFDPDAGGPLGRYIMENERMTILDCIVPTSGALESIEREETHPDSAQSAPAPAAVLMPMSNEDAPTAPSGSS